MENEDFKIKLIAIVSTNASYADNWTHVFRLICSNIPSIKFFKSCIALELIKTLNHIIKSYLFKLVR